MEKSFQNEEIQFFQKVKTLQVLQSSDCFISTAISKLPLDKAFNELKQIKQPDCNTPILKLLVLRNTFISLEGIILENPELKIILNEDVINNNLSNSPSSSPRQRRNSGKISRKLSIGRLSQKRRHSQSHSKNDDKQNSKGYSLNQKSKLIRNYVMDLAILLLMYYFPPNFRAHLEFISFHGIYDENYSILSLYYEIFYNSYNYILNYEYSNNLLRQNTFFCGLIDDNLQETIPVSLDIPYRIKYADCGKHNYSILLTGKFNLFNDNNKDSFLFTNVLFFLEDGNVLVKTTRVGNYELVDCLSNSTAVCAGTNFFLSLKLGQVWSWGMNTKGQLGFGEQSIENVSIPRKIKFKDKVEKISCGSTHALALLHDGNVLSWGNGENGRLGHGNTAILYSPKKINSLTSPINEIVCGHGHSICIDRNGFAFSFGRGSDGQLGHGDLKDMLIPKKIENLPKVTCCSAYNHNLAITSLGLFAWGRNRHGELGIGYKTPSESKPILFQITNHSICYVSCGANHSCAISNSGTLFTWGDSRCGQLGQGDNFQQVSPFELVFFRKASILSVSAGFSKTIIIEDV